MVLTLKIVSGLPSMNVELTPVPEHSNLSKFLMIAYVENKEDRINVLRLNMTMVKNVLMLVLDHVRILNVKFKLVKSIQFSQQILMQEVPPVEVVEVVVVLEALEKRDVTVD